MESGPLGQEAFVPAGQGFLGGPWQQPLFAPVFAPVRAALLIGWLTLLHECFRSVLGCFLAPQNIFRSSR